MRNIDHAAPGVVAHGVAAAVVISPLGLSAVAPAWAAEPDTRIEGDHSHAIDDGVEVEGRSVTAAGDEVAIMLPGRVTSDEVDTGLVPEGRFKGTDEAVTR